MNAPPLLKLQLLLAAPAGFKLNTGVPATAALPMAKSPPLAVLAEVFNVMEPAAPPTPPSAASEKPGATFVNVLPSMSMVPPALPAAPFAAKATKPLKSIGPPPFAVAITVIVPPPPPAEPTFTEVSPLSEMPPFVAPAPALRIWKVPPLPVPAPVAVTELALKLASDVPLLL